MQLFECDVNDFSSMFINFVLGKGTADQCKLVSSLALTQLAIFKYVYMCFSYTKATFCDHVLCDHVSCFTHNPKAAIVKRTWSGLSMFYFG